MVTAREVEVVRLNGEFGGGMVASLGGTHETRQARQNVRAPGLGGAFVQAAYAKD